MATYTLRRKLYSDDENSGMSTGAKIAAGLGTAATIAGGIYGARKGWFGKGAQKLTGGRTVIKGTPNMGAARLNNGMEINKGVTKDIEAKITKAGGSTVTNTIKAPTVEAGKIDFKGIKLAPQK